MVFFSCANGGYIFRKCKWRLHFEDSQFRIAEMIFNTVIAVWCLFGGGILAILLSRAVYNLCLKWWVRRYRWNSTPPILFEVVNVCDSVTPGDSVTDVEDASHVLSSDERLSTVVLCAVIIEKEEETRLFDETDL